VAKIFDTEVRLNIVVAIFAIVGTVVGALMAFETRSAHDKDMNAQKEYITLYIKTTAQEAAEVAIDKWVARQKGPHR
jgi:predicted membrane chloride channel (bestrophin family)